MESKLNVLIIKINIPPGPVYEAKILGCDPKPHEMWKQSHCRKGSKLFDKDLNSSSSLVSDIDSDENIEEENLLWVDDRFKYDGHLVEKYGVNIATTPNLMSFVVMNCWWQE
ncbi:hypothetical protein R6Q59_020275 [Mikania micrantha]